MFTSRVLELEQLGIVIAVLLVVVDEAVVEVVAEVLGQVLLIRLYLVV